MRHSTYCFTQLPRFFLSILLPVLVASVICASSRAQQPTDIERKGEQAAYPADEEKRSLINMKWSVAPPKAVINGRPDGRSERKVEINSEEQYEQGNVTVAIGNVRVSDGEV